MSCNNNNCYLPQPARAWSRVQNSCSLETSADNNGQVRVPYTNQFVSASLLYSKMDMLNKGNVLQYKANSSNLTKAQKYSKIAKGQWVNRNTTWATQSTRGYTNPNNTSLKRSGNVVNIAIDPITGAVIGPTTAPPTCPKPVTPVNPALPSNGGGGSDVNDPDIPPPVEPTEGSDVFPPIIPDTPVEPIVIQDGGVLICSEQENVCTGETKRSLSQQLCNPTSDSDVPGPIQELCWNDGTPTWYPRSRYIMTNSDNKWPVNYKEFTSAIVILNPPILLTAIGGCASVDLSWSYNFDHQCIPITNFNIYIDGIFVLKVPYTTTTININELKFNTEYSLYITSEYIYYVNSLPNKSESPPSNIILATTFMSPQPPSGLSATGGCASISLSWQSPSPDTCIDGYNIYYSDGTFIIYVLYPSLNATINNLNFNTQYSFYVTSYNSNAKYNSGPSNISTAITNPLNTPTLEIGSYNTTPSPSVILNLSYGNSDCTTIPYSYNLYGGSISPINIPSNGQPTPYTLTLNYSTIYTLYITYLANNNQESTQSNNVTINTNIFPPTQVNAVITGSTTATLSWTAPINYFVTGYTIYQSTNSGTYSQIGTSGTISYNISNLTLTQGDSYQFYVVANYNNNNSSEAYSNVISLTEFPETSGSLITPANDEGTSGTWSNFYLPNGYTNFNFAIYGGGGNQFDYGGGGAGAGAFISAINIPYSFGGNIISSINWNVSPGGQYLSNSYIVINYSNSTSINLQAQMGSSYSDTNYGSSGGSASYSNTTSYDNSNINAVNGSNGGNAGQIGQSNGYTSSGSGSGAGNAQNASNTYNTPDGQVYVISSQGGSQGGNVSGYGAGGGYGNNYNGNIGSVGVIVYYLST